MPIRKYRSVDEMELFPARQPAGGEGLRAACELSELAFALRPWRFDPGVRKFRAVEDASRERQRWEARQVPVYLATRARS